MPSRKCFEAGIRKQYSYVWNQQPRTCLLEEFDKKKHLKFQIKDVLFEYFSARIWKILLSYLKSACSSLSISKIGPKTPGFGIFGLEFENNFVIFEINLLKIVSLQNLAQKIKILHMVPKMAYLGFLLRKMGHFGLFWEKLWRTFCHIWNQHPQICLFAKFHEKTVMPKIWPEMPDLSVFGLKFKNNTVIFEISTLKFV